MSKPTIFAALHGTGIAQVTGDGWKPQEPLRIGMAGAMFTEPTVTTTDTGKFLLDYEHPNGLYEHGTYTFVASRWTAKGWKEAARTTMTV